MLTKRDLRVKFHLKLLFIENQWFKNSAKDNRKAKIIRGESYGHMSPSIGYCVLTCDRWEWLNCITQWDYLQP